MTAVCSRSNKGSAATILLSQMSARVRSIQNRAVVIGKAAAGVSSGGQLNL